MPKISVHVDAAQPDDVDPIDVEIEGNDRNGNPIEPLTFRCFKEIPGVIITNLIQVAETNPNQAGFMLMTDLIDKVLLPDELERYRAAINSDKILVKLEHLAKIGKGLIEVYSSNPTSAPSGSTAGQPQTGPTSMDAYLSPQDATPPTSTRVDSATSPTPSSSMTRVL